MQKKPKTTTLDAWAGGGGGVWTRASALMPSLFERFLFCHCSKNILILVRRMFVLTCAEFVVVVVVFIYEDDICDELGRIIQEAGNLCSIANMR